VPTLPVPPAEFVVALALATVGSAIQGSVGFGLAVVSAPVLLIINTHSRFVPGPLLIAAMILTLLIAHRERSAVVPREVAIATFGRVLGMLPAAYALSVLSQAEYNILFSVLILMAVGLSLSGWHLRPTPGTLLAASTLSAITSTISSVGGPPLALVYQHQEGPHIRGTMSTIFTIGTVISLAGVWWAGKFGLPELLAGLLLAPGVLVGFYLSRFATRHIDGPRIRPLILGFSALSALSIIAKVLWLSG
jgi:uncharacterized membrane protein YfcA